MLRTLRSNPLYIYIYIKQSHDWLKSPRPFYYGRVPLLSNDGHRFITAECHCCPCNDGHRFTVECHCCPMTVIDLLRSSATAVQWRSYIYYGRVPLLSNDGHRFITVKCHCWPTSVPDLLRSSATVGQCRSHIYYCQVPLVQCRPQIYYGRVPLLANDGPTFILIIIMLLFCITSWMLFVTM